MAKPRNSRAKRARTSSAAARKIKTACPDSRGFDCRPLHLILTPGVTTCLVSISPANHRLGSNMKLRAKVWRVWQEIKTNPHALSSFSMGTKGDTPKKPANVQRAISSVNDNCRLCCCPLKEGREGVKGELGLALLWTGKMGFTRWDWD